MQVKIRHLIGIWKSWSLLFCGRFMKSITGCCLSLWLQLNPPILQIRIWCLERWHGFHSVIWICLNALTFVQNYLLSLAATRFSSQLTWCLSHVLTRPHRLSKASAFIVLTHRDLWPLASLRRHLGSVSFMALSWPLVHHRHRNVPPSINSWHFLSWSSLHLISHLVPFVWKTGFWHSNLSSQFNWNIRKELVSKPSFKNGLSNSSF